MPEQRAIECLRLSDGEAVLVFDGAYEIRRRVSNLFYIPQYNRIVPIFPGVDVPFVSTESQGQVFKCGWDRGRMCCREIPILKACRGSQVEIVAPSIPFLWDDVRLKRNVWVGWAAEHIDFYVISLIRKILNIYQEGECMGTASCPCFLGATVMLGLNRRVCRAVDGDCRPKGSHHRQHPGNQRLETLDKFQVTHGMQLRRVTYEAQELENCIGCSDQKNSRQSAECGMKSVPTVFRNRRVKNAWDFGL